MTRPTKPTKKRRARGRAGDLKLPATAAWERAAYPWAAAALALTLGALSLWKVTEQDIFWQIRAGLELASTRTFPEVDAWSYTARGEPWMNVQWLATLVFAGVYRAGGEAGLSIARAALVAGLFGLIAAILRRPPYPGSEPRPSIGVLFSLAPLAYLATSFRLELRSDTLVFLIFAWLLLLWSPRPSAQSSARRPSAWPPERWSVVAVVLAANVHVGTAPFVAALASFFVLTSDRRAPTKAGYVVLSVAALLLTPYHVRVAPFWIRHFFYASHTLMQNPDHQPFRWDHDMDVSQFGWHGVAWVAWTICAALGALFRLRGGEARWKLALALLGGAALTAMSLNRARAIPYQALFLLPLVVAAARGAAEALSPFLRARPWARFASGALVLAVLSHQAATTRTPWGLGLSRQMYPIGSVAFLREERPRGEVYHTFAYGAYTVLYLPEYPVCVDTRETMYSKLERDILDQYASPDATRELMNRWGVNTVLVPIPKTELVGGLGYRDLIGEYLPREQWALVHFDDISVVVVRRIPEHAGLTERSEFKYLLPNLPAGNFLRVRPEGERLARYRDEIRRCLARYPSNAFCQRSKELADAYSASLP